MANLTLRSRRGADGLPVHPVARCQVTYWSNTLEQEQVLRFTLRSDGAILRSVRLSNRWSGHAVAASAAPDAVDDWMADPVGRLGRYVARRYSPLPGFTLRWLMVPAGLEF